MFVYTRPRELTRWVKPELNLQQDIPMTEEMCTHFPWVIMHDTGCTGGISLLLTSGTVYGANVALLNAWKTRFNMMEVPDRHLTIRMQPERTPEELAVAMGRHPRLGPASQFSQLEPEILRLICDLSYY